MAKKLPVTDGGPKPSAVFIKSGQVMGVYPADVLDQQGQVVAQTTYRDCEETGTPCPEDLVRVEHFPRRRVPTQA